MSGVTVVMVPDSSGGYVRWCGHAHRSAEPAEQCQARLRRRFPGMADRIVLADALHRSETRRTA